MKDPHALAGIGWIVLSMALLASHDATAKFLMAGMAPLVLLWWRYLFQAVVATAVVAGRSPFRSSYPALQVVRGLLVIGSSLLAFMALKRLPLAEFTAICCLVPVAVTLLARFVLKEHISLLKWCFIGGGLAGAMLVIRPGGHLDPVGTLYAILVVLGYAGFQVLTGLLARRDGALTIQWYTSVTGALATTAVLPWTDLSIEAAVSWTWLAIAVVLGTLGQFFMVIAFSRAPASVLAPYLYSAMAFSALAGWWVFGQVPDGWSVAGMVLIAASGVAAATVRRSARD